MTDLFKWVYSMTYRHTRRLGVWGILLWFQWGTNFTSFSHTSFEWEQEQELMNPELLLANLTGKVVPVTWGWRFLSKQSGWAGGRLGGKSGERQTRDTMTDSQIYQQRLPPWKGVNPPTAGSACSSPYVIFLKDARFEPHPKKDADEFWCSQFAQKLNKCMHF